VPTCVGDSLKKKRKQQGRRKNLYRKIFTDTRDYSHRIHVSEKEIHLNAFSLSHEKKKSYGKTVINRGANLRCQQKSSELNKKGNQKTLMENICGGDENVEMVRGKGDSNQGKYGGAVPCGGTPCD